MDCAVLKEGKLLVLTSASVLCFALCFSGQACAGASTGNASFNVKLAIVASFDANAGTGKNVDFGTVSDLSISSDKSQSTSLSIKGTDGASAMIALAPVNSGSGQGMGEMLGQGQNNQGVRVKYYLWHDSAESQRWGSDTGYTYSYTGTGSVDHVPIYVTLVKDQNIPVGKYEGTVDVIITY